MIRVCFTGAESTGKSTLAATLAARFDAVVVSEFGREWAETNGVDFTPDALRAIAGGHLIARMQAEQPRPELIIEDTDIVTTAAWFRMLHGHRDPMLTGIMATAHEYLLFAADTPFVADGTRQFDGDERTRFHDLLVDEMTRRGITPVLIQGDWAEREALAVAAIELLLA